jgi:hypothetical protein
MTTRGQISEAAEHEGGHTELMRAALEGETATVERLLESGTNVNKSDDEGRTALMFAVTNIHRDTANVCWSMGQMSMQPQMTVPPPCCWRHLLVTQKSFEIY